MSHNHINVIKRTGKGGLNFADFVAWTTKMVEAAFTVRLGYVDADTAKAVEQNIRLL